MNIYHIFIDDDEGGFMIAVGIISDRQACLIGSSFPTCSKIETWDGSPIYERKTAATVH